MKQENISVCMATYNGEKYIKAQILSILKQLRTEDELIIIDDGSTDRTVFNIKNINDKRIKLLTNNNHLGVNKNFERSFKIAKYKYIFMADQDDLWVENRVQLMINILNVQDTCLVSGNTIPVDDRGKVINYKLGQLYKKDSRKMLMNIIRIFSGKAYYYGCAMAFKRDLLNVICPFPPYIESHDLWIAMVAICNNSNMHLEDIVLNRRIHGKNASICKRNIIEKVHSRVILLKSLIEIRRRIKDGK